MNTLFVQGDRWYKFDDGDVTEVNMQDNDELKNQCWGGEYLSEVVYCFASLILGLLKGLSFGYGMSNKFKILQI